MNLSSNPFLVNLAATFHVDNIPLAIFILVLICLCCIFLLTLILLCIRFAVRRKYLRKSQKKRMKSIYVDELNTPMSEIGEHGQLTYMVEYFVIAKMLRVIIGEAKHLKVPSDTKSLDVYATLKVATEKRGKLEQIDKVHKTEIKRRTAFPRWYFQCEFSLEEEDLRYTRLIFELFDYDSLGQDQSIGLLDVPLSEIDQSKFVGATLECVGYLRPGEPKFTGLGELCVGLTFNAKTERIEIHIYEARQLKLSKLTRSRKTNHIYVTVEFRVKHRVLGAFDSSQQTELVNPYFNEKASFALKEQHLDEASFVCRLKRRGRLGRRHDLGLLTLGPDAESGTGAKHWEEMIRNSPRTHVMWHTLTPKSFARPS